MREWSGKRYWLIGASEGLGAALAETLSRAGAEVILSARSEDKLQTLAGERDIVQNTTQSEGRRFRQEPQTPAAE